MMDHSQAVVTTHTLGQLGKVANMVASQNLLEDYQAKRSAQTIRRQKADVALFAKFLSEAGHRAQNLDTDLYAWHGVTWGLVEAFNRWQLSQGYAVGSINVRLTTVRMYCLLAHRSEIINASEYALIASIKVYNQSDASNLDEKREQTRREGSKKASAVSIAPAHADLMKRQPNTRKGRRDAFIMCLLLDHGLRCGEISDLNVQDVNIQSGTIVFYRHKVKLTQTHDMTPDTLQAAQKYLADIPHDQEPLFVGVCSKARIDERSINEMVTRIGKLVGLSGLSPHDCRHFWVTDALKNDTGIKNLQDAGGWKSPAMPLRYAASAKVANKGVVLTATRRA